MMNRAYSLLDVKSVEEERRLIRGIATTPTPDRLGDVVEPLGVRFAADLPLLHHHDIKAPVGRVRFDKPSKDGIQFEAQLAKVDEPPSLRERIETAWGEIKAGLVRGVSIGFRDLESEPLNPKEPWGPQRYLKSEVLELSLVTVPANQDAQISVIRSIDSAALAATGTKRTADPHQAGVAAKSRKAKMDTAEQIKNFETQLTAKTEKRDTLLVKSGEENRTLDAAENEEFEELDTEIKALVVHLDRLRSVEKEKAATAKPAASYAAQQPQQQQQWDATRPFATVKAPPQLPPGIRFARYAKLKVLARKESRDITALAKDLYPDDGEVLAMVNRAAVTAATTTGATWASPLVNPLGFADFIEFLRPQTILGRFGQGGIPGFATVPFRTPFISQTSGGEAYWVGEGKPKPLTKFDFVRATLEPLKVANIAVATMELVRDSSPNADTLIRNGLAAAIAQRLDIDFILPTKAAVAGVSPASITNGITAIASSGTDGDSVRRDIKALITQFTEPPANNPPSSGVLIMRSSTAVALSLMVNPLGQQEFGTATRAGGTLLGFPIVVSDHVPTGVVVMVNAADIYVADEGGVEVDMSDQASLEMADNPTNDSVTPTAIALVSMFQTNSIAFRAERTINWTRRRAQSVSMLSGVNWGAAAGP